MVATKTSAPASVGDRNFFCPSSSSNPSDCPTIPKHSNAEFSSRVCESSHSSLASCGPLCAFCSVDRLFSISCGLFCQKQGGGAGLSAKIARHPWEWGVSRLRAASRSGPYLCPDAAGNTVCWDGGMGTSPLRSRQRMEFKTWLLASSAWRQFIAADAFAPAAVGALAL
jgi:hypothetical protein